MRLESAMRASREGLVAHGQAISVIGDNISNANTTAFKEQRTEFVALLGEQADDRGASLPTGAGDGVVVGRIRSDFTVGSTNPTGRDLDVALTGAGFFLVGDPQAPSLTRLGNFQVNQEGLLVTSEGLPVLGYSGTDNEVLGTINMVNLDAQPTPTTEITLFGNVNGSSQITQPPANPATFKELNDAAAFVSTQTAYDAQGKSHDIQLFYFKTAPNQWTVQAYVNGEDVGQAANLPVQLGQTSFSFNAVGQIPEEQQAQAVLNLNPAWAGGVEQTPFTLSLANMTQYAGGSRIVNVQNNGRGTGDIVSFEIGADGKIFGTTATGGRIQAGTLAVGLVNNNDGLLRTGNSLYSVTQESGPLRIGQAQTEGRGGMQGEALELSNVDLPKQFVDMIVYQRGYQASSQVLSAASGLLKDTIAMIR
ncbi:MAG: flagellar hook protein FlgE [Pseudomonadota bacterium]|jgi:flagellar hook protein FlgE